MTGKPVRALKLSKSETCAGADRELRKALRLLRMSNAPPLEWLKSPVVYRHDPVCRRYALAA